MPRRRAGGSRRAAAAPLGRCYRNSTPVRQSAALGTIINPATLGLGVRVRTGRSYRVLRRACRASRLKCLHRRGGATTRSPITSPTRTVRIVHVVAPSARGAGVAAPVEHSVNYNYDFSSRASSIKRDRRGLRPACYRCSGSDISMFTPDAGDHQMNYEATSRARQERRPGPIHRTDRCPGYARTMCGCSGTSRSHTDWPGHLDDSA